VGLEPVIGYVEGGGVIVWVIRPALPGIHDPVWPKEHELVSSSGSIPLSVAVLDGLACPTYIANTLCFVQHVCSFQCEASSAWRFVMLKLPLPLPEKHCRKDFPVHL